MLIVTNNATVMRSRQSASSKSRMRVLADGVRNEIVPGPMRKRRNAIPRLRFDPRCLKSSRETHNWGQLVQRSHNEAICMSFVRRDGGPRGDRERPRRLGQRRLRRLPTLVEHLRQAQSLHVRRGRTLAAASGTITTIRSRRYYGMLDRIDWVAYYKNHGYQINSGCGMGCGPNGGSGRVQFAPVFVSPQMQWAVPNTNLGGSPSGPGFPSPQMFPGFGPPAGGGLMPRRRTDGLRLCPAVWAITIPMPDSSRNSLDRQIERVFLVCPQRKRTYLPSAFFLSASTTSRTRNGMFTITVRGGWVIVSVGSSVSLPWAAKSIVAS